MSEANTLNMTIQNDILYQISLLGDAAGLEKLIREDALVLDRASAVTLYGETPLHIAAMRGHFDFARVLLAHKPELAHELDSLNRVPLHWACEKGYTQIVKELLQKSPDACFWRDLLGKIPLHLAVMKRRNDVVIEFARSRPESIPEKVENGGTILHLFVRYNSLYALKLLINTEQGRELVNALDDHGNTIMGVAVIFKQVEIVRYLLSEGIGLSMKRFTSFGMDSRALETKILLLEAEVDKLKNSTLNLNRPPATTSVAEKCKKWWNKYMTTVRRTILSLSQLSSFQTFKVN